MFSVERFGRLRVRRVARNAHPTLLQEPPRHTHSSPVPGPVGLFNIFSL